MPDLTVGVVGTGQTGTHHARIYADHPDVDLVGVHDSDHGRARSVAREFGTTPLSLDALLSRVEAVSVVVPTEHHYAVASDAIDAGVNVLVTEPFVEDPSQGEALIERATEQGVALQVGHVDRFNPAVQCVADLVSDLDVVAMTAQRLGPTVGGAGDSVVLDAMSRDLAIASSLVDSDVTAVSATGTENGEYAAATVSYEGGVVGQFTASRITPQRVRRLSITTSECRVNVDYGDQTVEVHRRPIPESISHDGTTDSRERLVERPSVDDGDPLEREIDSFLDAVRGRREPVVDGHDGLRTLLLARQIEDLATELGKQTATNASR